jgi:8-oxo-dGTP diphosphatase
VITFLVRHADAGNKGSWDGPDEERPLSLAGFRQAEGLVMRMEDYPVDRILCSPTVRCQQTVQPLARDRLLPIEPVAALGVDAGLNEVLELFWDQRLRNTVLCTHGETIGRLLDQLATQGLVAPVPLHWPKGSTWLLHRTDRREVHARYLSPYERPHDRQPNTIPSAEPDGAGSGRRIMRNEVNSPRRAARIGMSSAT